MKLNWEDLQKAIVESANQTIPLRRKQKHPWWNAESEKAVELRRGAWLRWNNKKTQERYEEFLNSRRTAAKKF